MINIIWYYLPITFIIPACGGQPSLTDAATKSITNATNAEMVIETICAPPDDAGACVPGQVRQLDRVAICDLESVLYSYGKPIPEGGPQCQSQ